MSGSTRVSPWIHLSLCSRRRKGVGDWEEGKMGDCRERVRDACYKNRFCSISRLAEQ